jgi:hypothetical protein
LLAAAYEEQNDEKVIKDRYYKVRQFEETLKYKYTHECAPCTSRTSLVAVS